MSTAKATPSLGVASHTAAQSRVIEAALLLFAEHGIGGTSLQMIADAIGVTKAAVYHQYNTKEEIVLAVAHEIMAPLEAAVSAAEAERSHVRACETLIAEMIALAVERRRVVSVLQRDPVMIRVLGEREPFRRVMERVNRVLMGKSSDAPARIRTAMIAAGIAGAVIHPLLLDVDDETLRAQLRKETLKLLALGRRA